MVKSRNIIATPPGATIEEQLIDRNMSQKEFAVRMDMPEKSISQLIRGEILLTDNVAIGLEMVLGVPAHFWHKLECIYREKVAKATAENRMDADIQIAKKFPYREMAKKGWIPETKTLSEKVIYLRKYFEVVQLSLLNESLLPNIACRRFAITEKADFALIAWAQKVKIEARTIATEAINLEYLKESLSVIRSMTIQNPEDFCPQLVTLLAKCGVALVFIPHLDGSFLQGATFYDSNKIVIGLTIRGKDSDKFWFSLFHELGHILLGHLSKNGETVEDDECAADKFARDILLPTNSFEKFVSTGDFSKEAIIDFAGEMNIAAGIIIGRLQKEKYIPYNWHNDLKNQYSFKQSKTED